jgi:hypothetical protein
LPPEFCRRFTFPVLWKHNRDIRLSVQSMLSDYEPSLRNSAAMAVSELVENAIKYGTPTAEMEEILVEIEVLRGRVSIRVTNGCDDPDSLSRLSDYVYRATNEDPFDMMLARLQKLRDSRGRSMGLGIYRIAAEGGFSLRLECGKKLVSVVAERSVSDGA